MKKFDINEMIKEEIAKTINEIGEKYPSYELLKQYPGMEFPPGTIFTKEDYGHPYTTETGHSSTGWTEDYFKPWIDEFFKEVIEFSDNGQVGR